MSDSKDERSFLRGAEELEAHLAFLAGNINAVTLTLQNQRIQGRVGRVTEAGRLPFYPHNAYRHALPSPSPMTRVLVEYRSQESAYTFRTRISGAVESGPWLLYTPQSVECSDRRQTVRYPVEGDPSFSLSVAGDGAADLPLEQALLDLSPGGVGFHFDPRQLALRRGSLATGWIGLPGDLKISVLLRITNVRSGIGRQRVAGARFADLPLEDRRLLSLILVTWDGR